MLDERHRISLGRVDFKGGYLLVPSQNQPSGITGEVATIRERVERRGLSWMSHVGIKPGCSRVMQEFSLGGSSRYIAKHQPTTRYSRIIDELQAASFIQSLLPELQKSKTIHQHRLGELRVELAAEQPVAGIVLYDANQDKVQQAASVFRWVPGIGGHESEVMSQTASIFGIPVRDLDPFLRQVVKLAFEYFRANGLTWSDARQAQTIINRVFDPQDRLTLLRVTLVDFESCLFSPRRQTIFHSLFGLLEDRFVRNLTLDQRW
ncbi:hypothetical protein A2631_01825 [Candidatus Daviesbacteria bacterium RIFCSPHIGHO2_01_FULL_44_29]|uniref:Uncharacterized protein n=1 Tax=Candidatus Daviesbacteria bacterium RIFCSPHIGHO2_02_FULL_43_12 TaxID=1797776 RepID=A0A1F5KJQ1_9BACT|nr:MAG: hypothetical protein A2631_01825 [Candidatus Daviesbacteria bacterium RIFCSPHIGHO2_01_FULL_44_29]OGE39586.1 MAG: hypothetical protein A3E86_02085 [Candidatus Daviesbacteria bacterium RIFCSPHIGHO2_12_FULL_47_45]OGE41138.1 MAG: hypothetical protein A3D25_01220 [Candidatus Daviesbacteria bacterium RIFCSPHIGHO2_02_FULL_43_12]OGE69337.1 MAG: hypothetical protein A3B55_02960 [Candidatus Daviesbacteria bacterium RIFCSPLOWO2_01_FULL_43_15]